MVSRKLCLKQVKNFTFLILLRLISLFVFFSKPLSIVHNLMVCTTQHITALLDCLKELCDEIPLKMWKEAINYIANTKEGSQGIRHWWTNMETIEADWNYGFWKLASQTVFQSSLVLFVTFDMVIGRHVCLTRSCDFLIHKYFLKFNPKRIQTRDWHYKQNELDSSRDTAAPVKSLDLHL